MSQPKPHNCEVVAKLQSLLSHSMERPQFDTFVELFKEKYPRDAQRMLDLVVKTGAYYSIPIWYREKLRLFIVNLK